MILELRDAAFAEDTGRRLARTQPVEDSFASVWLTGDLGAGKTTLARGYLRECGVTGIIRSPTYTLVELYETARGTLLHLDLYRLTSTEELEPLGLREWARAGSRWLVEWPERAREALPAPDLLLRIIAGPRVHLLEPSAASGLGAAWLARFTSSMKEAG